MEKTPIEGYTNKWICGLISNYEYLKILNRYAERSLMDLTHYPVFPWVLQDYTSQQIDLADPKVYRDLSKPIGALDFKRLQDFRARFYELPEAERYLYGTHYSSPGYVIGFLVRESPRMMLKFQSGKFDNPNRIFRSIKKEWESCLTNPGNVKELIP